MRTPFAAGFTVSLVSLAASLSACDTPQPAATSDAGQRASAPASPGAPLALPVVDAGSYAPSSAQQAIAQRLAGSILVGGHSMDYLRELADGIGPRLTGSASHARAAAWAADAFRKAGVASVAIEPFTIPFAWERRPVAAQIVAPLTQELHASAFGWALPTGAEGVRGEVVKVKDLSPAALAKQGDALRGRIALVDRPGLDSVKNKIDKHVALARLATYGVVALVVCGARDNDVLGASALPPSPGLAATFPGIGIGKEDGERIGRLLEKGAVTVSFVNESPVRGPTEVPNVIAEIRGRELPDEWVLFGAHLDSWDLATGAQDNGSGSVQVLEAARAIAALSAPPRRSIRFALWGGEEEGLLGSTAYVAAHDAELDRAVYVLNSDHGAGAPKGLILDGRADAVDAMRPLSTSLLAGLGAPKLDTEMECNTDHCAFMLKGVPTANLDVDGSKYDDVHHTPADTLDKVAPGSLAAGAAIMAVLAYAIADAPERLAKRLDHAAVAANLKKADLIDVLVSDGTWKP